MSRYHRILDVYQQTSRDAWASIAEMLPAIDAAIIRQMPQSSDEIELITGLKHQTVSAQISHMKDAGILEDSGGRRLTRKGRNAIVWQLTPKARNRGLGDLPDTGPKDSWDTWDDEWMGEDIDG